MQKSHRLLSVDQPQTIVKANGVCALLLQIGTRQFLHFASVVPQLPHPLLVGADILVRLGAQLDTVNHILWSQANIKSNPLYADPELMRSGQTIPQACQVASEFDVVIPARTAGFPLKLAILKGQELKGPQAFFQPLPLFQELSLTVCGTPLLELDHRSAYLLVQNSTSTVLSVAARQPLGLLIDSSYHDFELTIPVIGEVPPSLVKPGSFEQSFSTFPDHMIFVAPHETLQNEQIYSANPDTEQDMVVYALAVRPESSASSQDDIDPSPGEPYPGFENEIQQQLKKADALTLDAQRNQLRELFYDFQNIWSRDSNDCGVTDLHTVKIPTDPSAPPTFVRQYKIPIAAYESIQETLDALLEKRIIRECNSTYNSPLWPVLKPNGKDWDVKLPLVLMAIRSTPHRTTGVTPFEMMTGREMTLPLHLLYRPEDVSVATAYTAHQYVSDLQDHLRSIFSFAQTNIEASVKAQKAYYDRKTSDREYQVGAKVLYFNFTKPVGVSKKFLPNWSGPYEIVGKLSPVAYRIRVSKPNRVPTYKWVHINQIKPFEQSPLRRGVDSQ